MSQLDDPPLLPCENCQRQSTLWYSGELTFVEYVGTEKPGIEIYRCPVCDTHFRWGEALWNAAAVVRPRDLPEVLEHLGEHGTP